MRRHSDASLVQQHARWGPGGGVCAQSDGASMLTPPGLAGPGGAQVFAQRIGGRSPDPRPQQPLQGLQGPPLGRACPLRRVSAQVCTCAQGHHCMLDLAIVFALMVARFPMLAQEFPDGVSE